MRNNYFPHLLLGRKLQLDRQQRINESVEDQVSFDELFKLIFHHERLVAQRAMRAIMVVVKNYPEFLQSHTDQLLSMVRSTDYKDIKPYIVQLVSKLNLQPPELDSIWHILTYMALNANEQKAIRVYALQSMYELTHRQATFVHELHDTLNALRYELTPSIQVKVMKLRVLLDKMKVNA